MIRKRITTYKIVERIVRLLLCLCILAILLVAGSYVYLTTVGFPRSILRKVAINLRTRGIRFDVAGVHLNSPLSISFDKLQISGLAGQASHTIYANRLTVGLSLNQWPIHPIVPKRFHIEGGNVILMAQTNAATGNPVFLTVSNINLRYEIASDRLHYSDFSADVLGIHLAGSGRIVMDSPHPMILRQGSPLTVAIPLSVLAAQAIDDVKGSVFVRPPSANISFEFHPQEFHKSRATLFLRGGVSSFRAVCIEEWSLIAELLDGKVIVPSAHARQGMESLSFFGSYNTADRFLEARLSGKLVPRHWLDLLPPGWQKQVAQRKLSFQGPVEFDVRSSSAPADDIVRHWSGWGSLSGLDLNGYWIEKLFLSFSRDDDRLNVSEISGLAGRNEERGPLNGTFAYNFKTRDFHAQFYLGIDPRPLFDRCMPKAMVLPPITFRSAPPIFDLELRGTTDKPENFALATHVRASDFIYNGEPVSYFDANISFSNQVLVMDPLLMVHDTGHVTGRLQDDFARQIVDLDLVSSVSPYSIGRIVGPSLERLSHIYRFEGPAHIAAKGMVDYANGEFTDIDAKIDGAHMGYGWFLADEASFRLRIAGQDVDLDDVQATWFGGAVSGAIEFAGIDSTNNVHYRCAAEVTNAPLTQIARALGQSNFRVYDGALSGTCRLSGILGIGNGRTCTGDGYVQVANGSLMQVPLLGGLSKFVARLYPGLGYAYQRNFEAPFVINNGKAHTDSAALSGKLLSVSAHGDYNFDTHMDFRVSFHPLEEGMVAEAVRVLTSPASWLFEFHLGGTVTNPKWEIINLPKELWNFF